MSFDPIGIVADAFQQVLEHLRDTNQQLLLARDEIQAILDAAGAGIVVVDRSMRIEAYNRWSERLFPAGAHPVAGRRMCELLCQREELGHREPVMFRQILDSEPSQTVIDSDEDGLPDLRLAKMDPTEPPESIRRKAA